MLFANEKEEMISKVKSWRKAFKLKGFRICTTKAEYMESTFCEIGQETSV